MEIWKEMNTEGSSEATHELQSTCKKDPAWASGGEAAGCGDQRNSIRGLGSRVRAGDAAQLAKGLFFII